MYGSRFEYLVRESLMKLLIQMSRTRAVFFKPEPCHTGAKKRQRAVGLRWSSEKITWHLDRGKGAIEMRNKGR